MLVFNTSVKTSVRGEVKRGPKLWEKRTYIVRKRRSIKERLDRKSNPLFATAKRRKGKELRDKQFTTSY